MQRHRFRIGFVAAYAAAFVSLAAPAAEPRIGKMVAYELPDYTIYTTRGEAQARNFANELAKFRVMLEGVLRTQATASYMPTHMVILSRDTWEKHLQPRKMIAGIFQSGRFANYIVMDGDAEGSDGLHLIFHEYTHYFVSSRFAGEYPPFFNEGMAELMGYSKFDKKKNLAIVLIPVDRVREARDGDWIPFERLLRVDRSSPEYISHKLADSFYAQSWLTLHYGLVENREFGRQMLDYVRQLNRLVPQADAAKAAFGDLAAADAKLRAHSRTSNLASGGFPLSGVAEVTLPPGKPVSETDALALIADLQLKARIAPDRIRPVVESLGRREPESARATVLAARLALWSDDDAAFDAAIDRAAKQLTPADTSSRRDLASVLLQSVQQAGPMRKRSSAEEKQDLTRSLNWFGEVINTDNQDVEALWGFGSAATELDIHLDVAEDALVAAYKMMPTNSLIALGLANLKSRQQKPEEMLPYLDDILRYAGDLGMRQWAASTRTEMKAWIAERDKIDEENRKQREAYEKQKAEYEKKYPPKKKKTP